MVEVFWGSGSPFAWSVLLGFEVKRAPYESRLISFSDGDLDKPEFRAVNPRGKVPAIRDGAMTLAESNAILAWLDRKHPEPPLFGTTAEETGRIWRAVIENVSYLQQPAGTIARALFRGKVEEQRAELEAAAEALGEEIAGYERRLAKGDWLEGGRLTAADLTAYPHFELLFRIAGREDAKTLGLGFEKGWAAYPALSAWRDRIRALPGYEKTYPPHWGRA